MCRFVESGKVTLDPDANYDEVLPARCSPNGRVANIFFYPYRELGFAEKACEFAARAPHYADFFFFFELVLVSLCYFTVLSTGCF